MELREYQKNIVSQVFDIIDNVLIVLPTGGGKTVIAKEIISRINTPILFIVPKLELIRQAANTFDEECDIIWSSQTMIYGNHITVASKQTIMRRDLSKYFSKPVTVIVDEAHIGLQSLKNCLKGIKIYRIIGLTATPERNDGKSFLIESACKNKCLDKSVYEYAVFDRVINDWNIQELQKLGYLSPLHVTINPAAENLRNIKPKHRYDDELDSDVIMDELGDEFFRFIDKAKEFKGKPTIIFTPDLKSLDVVLITLQKSNLNYEGIDGSMEVEKRKVILDRLKNGEIDGVVNCGVLTTGFDMPCVKQCILIRHIKSKILFFQIVGRFIRPYENQTAEIYDFAGTSYNFATASNPDVFSKPVEWKYEGFEIKESEEEREERERSEELQETIGEMNLTWTDYLKDPVSTLLKCLLEYKENFEINLIRGIQQKAVEIEHKVKQQSEVELNREKSKLKSEIINNQEEVISQEVEKRIHVYGLNPVRSWFSENGFEWFRRNYPAILTQYEWKEEDKKKFNERDIDETLTQKLEKIRAETYKQLPFEDLPLDDSEVCTLYYQRTNWWLKNFKYRDS